ncbi:hypothetical protein GQ44DRAFT_70697 [Phaeosphaeriaceae sp. PMI808]|nr:hypothetical protein GQ44DRAFT_70697 [Phaeosphaeriaceae sp. PMI808]
MLESSYIRQGIPQGDLLCTAKRISFLFLSYILLPRVSTYAAVYVLKPTPQCSSPFLSSISMKSSLVILDGHLQKPGRWCLCAQDTTSQTPGAVHRPGSQCERHIPVPMYFISRSHLGIPTSNSSMRTVNVNHNTISMSMQLYVKENSPPIANPRMPCFNVLQDITLTGRWQEDFADWQSNSGLKDYDAVS